MRSLFLLLFACVIMPSLINAQNVFRSVQAGDWDDASTWFLGAGAGGIEGINFPSSTDSVFVLHDVDITATNSGSDFIIEGYVNVAAGVKLQCEVGNSSNGLVLDNNGVLHLYGTLYAAKAGETPATGGPGAVEFTTKGNSGFIAFTGAFVFVADDWEIEENSNVYIEDNVCIRVDDDVTIDGTGVTICGSGDISIAGTAANSTINLDNGATLAQVCSGTNISRSTGTTDCSAGTVVVTGTGNPGASPTAVDDKISTEINQSVNISVLTLGTDDSDPGLDTLQILKIGSNAAVDDNLSANGGIISIKDNGTPTDFTDDYVFYAPPAGFTGEDTFSYIIEDEEGLTDTALVTVNVFECGSTYVDLEGVGANGATTATLTFTDTTNIDSIRLDLIYKNGKPTFATFVSSAGETNSGDQFDAINIAGNDDGVYRTTISSASSVTVTHDNGTGVRSFIAYIYRQGSVASITSIADDQVVYLFNNSFSFTQEIPAGNGPRSIRVQMPISELNDDSRSALLEVQAGPVYGSLETFTADLGNSLKIFTLMLRDVPGDVTELDVTITSRTGGAGDSFITAGIDFGIQCSGTAPEAIPDYKSTPENTAVTINVLANDILGNGGFDTTGMTNLGLLDPQNGTVSFNAAGEVIYTPDGGFTGVDYFQYQICDTLQLCDITTVTISVTCAGGQFVEIAEELGLDLGGNKDGGLSWADLNADGLLDVIVNTNNGTNDTRIFFAEESAGVITFTDVTTTNASGLLDDTKERTVIIADLNNDGYPDFTRNEYNGTGIEIWFNRGPGSTPAFSFGDGAQDPNVEIGTFNTSGTVFNTEGMAIADWNQDGWLDLIVENDGGGIEILENDKDGTFSEVAHATSGFPIGSGGSGTGDYSTAIDYDNDGYVDYMARRASEVDLYRFDPITNKFVDAGAANLATNNSEKGAITFCDVDNDADFDIIWAHQSDDNNTSIYIQNDDGTFSFGTNLVNDGGIEECDCADIDNDGDNDIFLGDDAGNSYLFKNNTVKGGALSFTQDNDCIAPGADVEGSEFVDYDNDGDMDLYMNINGGDNQLWQNGQDDDNYIRVIPRIDLGSGRYQSAIGANVILVENCTDTCQIRDVSGGRGHGSQKPEVVHFGLPNGPNKSYKIIVYFVDKAGTRDTVIKSVTPSKLKNQEIAIYDTDDDFDLCLDADSDGVPNLIDIDDDNDGILDVDESIGLNDPSGDEDGDGIENWQDVSDGGGAGDGSATDYDDLDMNGVADIHDFDGDGVPDHYDLDSDNDGVPDIIEAGGEDTDGDGIVDVFADTDGNGWALIFDNVGIGQTGTPLTDPDTDNDGNEDRIDLDSDNDGIQDILEAGGVDFDGDGVDNGVDSDGDGLNDSYDTDSGGTPLADADSDLDGFKNRLDLDSDNDGIGDLTETGGEDADFNGLVDGVFADADNDGWSNAYDSDDSGTSLSNQDQDEDGLPNRIDIDADNDGIIDIVESQPTGTLIIPSGTDSDGDGIDDNFDPDSGNTLTDPENTDGTDNPDYLDLDTDNDGDPDLLEGWDTDNDGVANTVLQNIDSDNDGLDDGVDTVVQSLGNGKTTNVTDNGKDAESYPDEDRPETTERDWREDKDNDNDGIPDIIDIDDDNDGIPDADECNNLYFIDFDTDAVDDGVGTGVLTDGTTSLGAVSYNSSAISNAGTSFSNTWSSQDGSNEVSNIDKANEEAGVLAGSISGVNNTISLPVQIKNPVLFINFISRSGSFDFSGTSGLSSLSLLDNSVGATISGKIISFPVAANGANSGFSVQLIGVFNVISFNSITSGGSDTYGFNLLIPGCDSDGDGVENAFDLDSDNDGIPDIVEAGGEDTDGNGLVDDITGTTLDNDTDNDGLDDRYDSNNGGNDIPNEDVDDDGVVNALDIDSDNDGILDVVEAGGTPGTNGQIENASTDIDNDGFADGVDGDVGNDGTAENSANALVLTQEDTDDDGEPDGALLVSDPDRDGIYNFYDIDADDDGIIDNIEAQITTANVEPTVADEDSDGLSTPFESDGLTPEDTDNDGIPDYLDTDSDNDGTFDVVEGWDTDGDGIPNTLATYTDADNDGLDEGYDDIVGPNNTTNPSNNGQDGVDFPNVFDASTPERDWREVQDNDGDGISDINDIDDDNDGILDVDEGCSTTSAYKSSFNSAASVGGAGAAVNAPNGTFALFTGNNARLTFDFDSVSQLGTQIFIAWREAASQVGTATFRLSYSLDNSVFTNDSRLIETNSLTVVNDTLLNQHPFRYLRITQVGAARVELDAIGRTPFTSCSDTDMDGVPDNIDLDSDNDGIADIIEAGGVDSNNDGVVDGVFSDGGNSDGWSDVFDDQDGSGGIPLADEDADGDGLKNRVDIDADNDGIVDVIEGQPSTTTPILPSGVDSDGDGIDDAFDSDSGNSLLIPTNTDGTDEPDYLDLDSDNDRLVDITEAYDTDGDGLIDTSPSGIDADNDGLDDAYDVLTPINDSTNVSNNKQSSHSFPDGYNPATDERDWREFSDVDNDGIADVNDLDNDNDGIPDSEEGCASTSAFSTGFVSAGGISGAGSIRFAPNNSYAIFIASTSFIDIDYSTVNGVGSFIILNWRERASQVGIGTLRLEYSLDNITYTAGSGRMITDNTTGVVDTLINEYPFRYLRIRNLTDADIEVDAAEVQSAPSCIDSDGDGITNNLDLDADNDGIPDIVEAGGEDVDGDGRVDDLTGTLLTNDFDNDGLDDRYDSDVAGGTNGVDIPNADSDGDLIPNALDLDADNDGIPDVVEAGGTDANGDGRVDNYLDGDDDGYSDVLDTDLDNDGTIDNAGNALTLTGEDTDNDGVPNTYPNDDFDGDGVHNFVDLDSDDDGIMDVIEAGGADTEGNAKEDGFVDTDGDGFNDLVDGDVGNLLGIGIDTDGANAANATTKTGADTDVIKDGVPNSIISDDFDGDGLYNFIDIDADNDGIVDNTEGQSTSGYEAPLNTDVDGDGIDTRYDDNDGLFGGAGAVGYVLSDIDGTENPDYLDLDSDGDGDLDAVEGHDDDNDGVADAGSIANSGLPGGTTDIDGDGLLDGYDNNTSSQDPTNGGFEGEDYPNDDNAFTPESDWRETKDNDNDGIPNEDDIDDDNDGILDVNESGTVNDPNGDEDGDGILNYQDIADIGNGGDGSTTVYTDGNMDGVPDAFDKDRDGIPDQFDLDSDNDGIPDIVEAGGVDSNDDGIVDGVFNDGNNSNGWSDVFDNLNLTGGTPLADGDKDNDGLPNRCDLDSDNDGLADIIEAGGVDTNGDGQVENNTDTDNDGWANTFDSDNTGTALTIPDTDGDGFENYLDLDSDSDGLTDNVEGQTTLAFLAPLGTDFDNDGWDDRYDGDVVGGTNGNPIVLSNNDGAGAVDYLSQDSDGDGSPDYVEGFDDGGIEGAATDDLEVRATAFEAASGNPNQYVNSDDGDSDGIPDWMEDADSDGVPNFLDPQSTFYYDVDNDGLINLYDTDDIPAGGAISNLPDFNSDGEPDFRDTDNTVGPLPIELIGFTATKVGAYVQLDWNTATEINNDYFTIERSIDGEYFEEILTEKGAGNSSTRNDYRRYDEEPELGYNYYKLTQTDFNGESESFNIEVVNFEGSRFSENSSTIEVNLYPNPTDGKQLTLSMDKLKGNEVLLEVMTAEGQLISQQEIAIDSEMSNYKVEILQGKTLAAGTYYLKVILQDEVKVLPFIVK